MADAWKYGGVAFPLPTSTANSLLQDADPALFLGLDYLSYVIKTYAGPRLLTQAAVCGAPIANAVELQLPYDPGPYLMLEGFKFPALFISRRNGINNYRTLTRSHETTQWALTYVLPALTPSQAQHMLPILHAIELLVAIRAEHGWDPAYTPPSGVLGGEVWKQAGLESISVDGCTYGGFEGMGNLWLPAITISLSVKERDNPLIATAMQGTDATVSLSSSDGTTLPVLTIDLNKNTPP